MKLVKINIENHGPFYGKQEASFSTDKEKNVTLFHGLNNVGKTSLLRAVVWCFYGIMIQDDAGATTPALNKLAESENSDRCNVEIEFTHMNQSFIFRRDLDGSSRTSSTATAWIKKDNGAKTPVSPDAVINKIVPKKLSSFFFIKGENPIFFQEKDDLTDSIEGILGITILNMSSGDIKSARRSFQALLRNMAGAEEVNKLLKDIALQEQKIEIYEEEAGSIDGKITEADIQLDDVLKKIGQIDVTAANQKSIERIENDIKRIEKDLKTENKKKAEWFRSHLASLCIMPISISVDGFLNQKRREKKLPYDYAKEFIEGIIEKGKCVCGTPVEKGSDNEEKLLKLMEDAPDRYINDYLWKATTYLGKAKQERIGLIRDLQAIDKAIYELEASRTSLIEERKENELRLRSGNEDASALIEKKDRLIDEIAELKTELNLNEEKHANEKITLAELRTKLRTAELQNVNAKKLQTLIAISDRLLEKIEGRVNAIRIDAKEAIQNDLNRILSENLRQRIVAKIDDRFQVLPESYVGGGVNRIVNFAYTASLLNYNKKVAEEGTDALVLPLFVDSAFGVNDAEYKKVLANFLPSLSEQLICLVSDSQGSSFSEELEHKIGQEFVFMRKESEPPANELRGELNIRGKVIPTFEYNCEKSMTKIEEFK